VPYRGYLFDLDGTIYRGNTPIPGAVEAVNRLVTGGAQVGFVTNNSAARPRQVALRLRAMGIEADADQVFGTGSLAARHLVERRLRSAYVVGEPALVETLREAGVAAVARHLAQAVVVGICRSLTYEMVDEAAAAVRRGAYFLATNLDATYPRDEKHWEPGAGAMVAAVATAALKQPDAVLGKPQPNLILDAMAKMELRPEETVVVGDRIDTDGHAAAAANVAFWLTLTGHESEIPEGYVGGADLSALD
jgi:4-nitrophenyl phosphatase